MKTAFTLLFMTLASISFAGTSDGGGGVGVRCPTGSSDIVFEVLDLHEIKLKGEIISNNPTTMDEAIDLSSYKLGNHFYMLSNRPPEQYIKYLKEHIVEKIFKGEPFTNPINGKTVTIEYVDDLPLSNDIGNYQIKSGCALEQVAYFYDDSNSLKIVSSRWDELSWADRSALVSHEIHYFLDRYNGLEDFGLDTKKTSERARHFVGMLYSKTGVEPKYKSIPKSGAFVCATNENSSRRQTYFAVFPSGINEFTVLFESVQNHSSSYATTAIFTSNVSTDLTDRLKGEMNSTQNLKISSDEVNATFSVKITKAVHEDPKFQAFVEQKGAVIPLGAEESLICWNPF